MSCWDTLNAYGLRAFGYGERLLPKSEITICEQFVLIGSGMMWNLYFGLLAVVLGFGFATLIALGKASDRFYLRWPSVGYIYLFRGTPLFIQFFFAYEVFIQLPKIGVELDLGIAVLNAETRWLTRAWLGALIVLFLNTAAYSAEIFFGALRAVPRSLIEAGKAMGLSPYQRFRLIAWPTLLRTAWPSYTNEAIFLYHATALVFFSSFPAWRQQGDALYYGNYFAEKTFNPFVAYPIVGVYFVLGTVMIIVAFGMINRRLNRHLNPNDRPKLRIRPQFIR